MTKDLRNLLLYSIAIVILSLGYFLYAFFTQPPVQEGHNWMHELGEGVGNVALWGMYIIYGRTALKLLLGKGKLAKRLIPQYRPPEYASIAAKGLSWLDRTHIHVGILTIAVVMLHIGLMGVSTLFTNLFFIAVLLLMFWQAIFGFVIRIKVTPAQAKRFSYSVHAQLITGVMIAIFGWLGHALVGD